MAHMCQPPFLLDQSYFWESPAYLFFFAYQFQVGWNKSTDRNPSETPFILSISLEKTAFIAISDRQTGDTWSEGSGFTIPKIDFADPGRRRYGKPKWFFFGGKSLGTSWTENEWFHWGYISPLQVDV